MTDTRQVIAQLAISRSLISGPKLLAVIANLRGAEEAAQYAAIHYLGFPFSISETFQRRNANSSVEEAFEVIVLTIADLSSIQLSPNPASNGNSRINQSGSLKVYNSGGQLNVKSPNHRITKSPRYFIIHLFE